jgi:hypothetical protein
MLSQMLAGLFPHIGVGVFAAILLAFALSVASILFVKARPAGVLWAALTVESPVLTWQRVDQALLSLGATPAAQSLFRALKSDVMGRLSGLQLQLITFSDLTADTNPLDGAIQVYAIYAKKQATATDAFFKTFDDATDDSTAGDARIALPLLESGDEAIAIFPDGTVMPTGLVIGSYTAYIGANGSTPSTTGDGPNGFLLVGA